MSIIRGTTPTLVFNVKNDIDLDTIEVLWITFRPKNGTNLKEKTYDLDDVVIDSAKRTITLNLTQEDTLAFAGDTMLVQIRARLTNDVAYASAIMEINIDRILKAGVI